MYSRFLLIFIYVLSLNFYYNMDKNFGFIKDLIINQFKESSINFLKYS